MHEGSEQEGRWGAARGSWRTWVTPGEVHETDLPPPLASASIKEIAPLSNPHSIFNHRSNLRALVSWAEGPAGRLQGALWG